MQKELKIQNLKFKTNFEYLKKFGIWNALYVKSRHEKKVAEYMEKYNMPCYLPLTKGLKIWSDRKKWVEEPLFRGYIFVPHNNLIADKILQIPGVVNFVRYDGDKALIKAEELKIIQHFIDQGYHIENTEETNLETGEWVEILSGPFKGVKGIVENKDKSNNTYLIFLDSIGQALKATLPKELLKKI